MAPAEGRRKVMQPSLSLDAEVRQEDGPGQARREDGPGQGRSASETRAGRLEDKSWLPAWLRRSAAELGETPQFLIGTGASRSRRIGGRRDRAGEGTSYVLQTGCFLWPGRAFHRDSYIVQRRERDPATRLSKYIELGPEEGPAGDESGQPEPAARMALGRIRRGSSVREARLIQPGLLEGGQGGQGSSSAWPRLDSMDSLTVKFSGPGPVVRDPPVPGGGAWRQGGVEEEEEEPRYERIKLSSEVSVDSGLGHSAAVEGKQEEEEGTEAESDSEDSSTEGSESDDSEYDDSDHLYENLAAVSLESPERLSARRAARMEGGREAGRREAAQRLIARMQDGVERDRAAQLEVDHAIHCNERIAEDIAYQLGRHAAEKEVARFRLHVTEWDSVTYLLLGLVTRLAKAEKQAEHCREDGSIRRRRDLLAGQLAEARWIKQNIEKRSKKVERSVERWLGAGHLASYRACLAEKERLVHERREVGDRLKLGLRQLGELEADLRFH